MGWAEFIARGSRPLFASSTMNRDEEEIAAGKRELKRQKKQYRDEKKRVTKELVSALRDPTVVVMADWLKVRGTLRKWNRYFCVLKPGLMIIYKTNKTSKHGQWVGTILLNTCKLIERPSKKDGFCFKLYQPLDQSIWATRGPLGESHGVVTLQPLPTCYLICRADCDQAGRCWMDALELSLRCTGLLMRTMHKLDESKQNEEENSGAEVSQVTKEESEGEGESHVDENIEHKYSETEAEKHFDGLDDVEEGVSEESEGDNVQESPWVESDKEQFGCDSSQADDVGEENKSLIWTLLKQIRPGMDLSKVVLPTFILEPRSFLEKFADYYYHADLLAEAVIEPDPLQRIIGVIRFYLSGFYKKPKGLKKPYNPILGETFRCCWKHPDGSTTYYIAEQVSHHPPISTLFVTNRKAGFNVSGTILAKSKYYGNSISAVMIGTLKVHLLARGETYTVTLPYANCKGIFIGTTTMELAGPVTIECDKTGYSCNLEFHLKPVLSGAVNRISGVVKLGSEKLVEINGHWDGPIFIKPKKESSKELWNPTPEVIARRLQRLEIPMDQQDKWESKKLWSKVTAAIAEEDQYKATDEKTVLEQEQRARAKSGIPHKTKYFQPRGDVFEYIHTESRPWDIHNDVRQVEKDYVVRTICKVKQRVQKKKTVSINHQARQSDESSDTEADEDAGRKLRSLPLETSQSDLKESIERIEHTLRRVEKSLEQCSQQQFWLSPNFILVIFGFTFLHAIILAILLKDR